MDAARNIKMPPGGPASKLAKVLLLGGAAVYGLTNSLFNVEGGHRAILFHRIGGLSDKVGMGGCMWDVDRHAGRVVRAFSIGADLFPVGAGRNGAPRLQRCRCTRKART